MDALAGCLRDTAAVARVAEYRAAGWPAGKRWPLPGEPMRPALDESLAAGAVAAMLPRAFFPEAELGAHGFAAACRHGWLTGADRVNGRWVEVGDGALVRRYAELDLSVGLVLGRQACLVIDTRGDPTQGGELADAVRTVTSLPWTVVLTHGHFDHCLGTAAFLPAPVHAHPRCRSDLASGGKLQHAEALAWARARQRPEPAPVTPVLPDRVVTGRTELDLGDRRVCLLAPGRGHTDHDLAVLVPDAGVLFAGDLVEHGAPPAFEDAYPQEWPDTLTALLDIGAATIVPGHGDPVDPGFVAAQRDELVTVARLCRKVGTGRLRVADALSRSPYDAHTTRAALAAAAR